MTTTTSVSARTPEHLKMMQDGVPIAVVLMGSNDKKTSGEIRYQHWDRRARIKRAFKFWGLLWGLSIASIPIPPIHWVLVPGLFLAGPIVAWMIFNQDEVLLGGEGTCPECGGFFPIARKKVAWPISDLCTLCYKYVSVSKLVP